MAFTTGKIVIGDEVVPTTYDYYSVNPETHMLHANTVQDKYHYKKYVKNYALYENLFMNIPPLMTPLMKSIKKHEGIGIMQDNSDEYFTNITTEDIVHRLHSTAQTRS